MKTKLFFLILLLINTPFYGQTFEGKFQTSIDSIYKANPESIGIMVHVESPNKNISWSGAVGCPDKNTQKRIESDQPGLIASSIKTYISATILRLVEEEKVEINESIKELISNKTRKLFESDGYNLDSITLTHLLSHTSGIEDYANQDYYDFITKNPKYRWTRDEQLELAIKVGNPLAKPGEVFRYADVNYLLLTEIIEKLTGSPFYTVMRNLLKYDELGLNNTWFPTLEEKPINTKPLVHQYFTKYNMNSYEIDISWDLYGGGGIACTPGDLARFSYNLFNSNIVKDTAVFNLIFTKINTQDSIHNNYFLGLHEYEYKGFKGYGHAGFWGSIVVYFPKLNTSISVFVLEFDKQELRHDIMEQIINILIENN